MSMFKRIMGLCLCLVLLAGFCLVSQQAQAAQTTVRAASFSGVTGPTLVKQNGIWYYVKNGTVCYDTTLVKFNGSWYYVKNGTTQPSMTTLVKFNGSWWYVVNGRVASNTTTLVKYNNEWWYVVNGKIASNTTSLVKYNGEWWYVVKGKIAGNTTTLVKYNGGWYYIYKGKLAAKTTTLVKFNGSWYYVENGKVNFSKTTLFAFGGKLYYVKNGTTQPTATTLVKFNNQWMYVKNGVFNTSTGFCTYGNQKYYVKNGVAQTSLSGKVTVNGSTYYLKNGVLTNCHSAGHSYQAATCTTDKVCTKCTYIAASALGHSYRNGTCTRCGISEGLPITLKIWAPSEDQYNDRSWLLQMEEQFAAAHPEYEITWENGVCSEGDASSMITRYPEANADVYMFANDQIGTLVQAGAVSSLEGNYLNQVVTDNSQTLVNTVTYSDGKVYGFPIANNTWFMYYNKDVFSEEDVKSLDTMLTKGTVAFPWSVSWYGGSFFLANGGTLFGSKGNDASAGIQFGGTKGYQAALKMAQLAANPNLKNDENGLGNAGLKTGEIDAYFSGSWDYAGLYWALGDKLGAVQLPMVEIGGVQKQMKSFAGSKVVGVNPHTQNKDAAMAFAAFLATPDAQLARYNIRGVIPAAKSLINNPAIKSNPVAVAEMNTMTNASVVQPFIPEMSQYWSPMGNFGCLIINGEVNESNYREQVDQMMSALNGEDFEAPTPSVPVGENITLRLHYHRPDGDYDGWNLWLWDPDGTVPLDPPYEFTILENEAVCTVQISTGIQNAGYVVRYGEWQDKDIHEDQFIDLTGILSGTVDVYVESGVKGHTIVYGDDVVQGIIIVNARYTAENLDGLPQLMVKLSSVPYDSVNPDSFTIRDSDGNVAITSIRRVNNYYYLCLGRPLTANDTCYISFENLNYHITIPG